MTTLVASPLAALPPAGTWPWAVVAAVAGAIGGRMLTFAVGGLLDAGVFGEPVRVSGAARRRIELVAVAAAVGLWWWEAYRLGLEPAVDGVAVTGGLDGMLPPRWLAHAVLFWLLAAAAWIDLRYRVIPDCVTVPGVLVGLALAWLLPDLFLPIACEEPRSFAPALAVPDVLAWWGGLRTEMPPRWMGSWPYAGGLVFATVIYSAWWFFLTVPFLQPVQAPGPAVARWRRIEPRTLILPAGIVGIVAAWAGGGDRFGGLHSALIGLAVSAGLVWAVREGASRALGREAMGLGDVTLMAMVGAWIGWQASVLAFFLAAFIGLAHGLVQVLRHRETELPYGPSLCLASAAVIVGWRPLWQWTGTAFAQPLELAAVIGAVVALTAATLFAWSRLRG